MTRRRVLLMALPVLLLSAAAVAGWFAWRPRKTSLLVDVEGSPGLTIKGTCDVDGRTQDLTITGSKKVPLEGYRVTFSLVSPEDAGEFRVWARGPDQTYGSAGSGNPPKLGVRGWVKSSWWGAPPARWIEAFKKDEQSGWIRPPP